MNHGSHWECIVPNVEETIVRQLPGLTAKLPNFGGIASWPEDVKPPEGWTPDSIIYLSESAGELRHVLVILSDKKTPRNAVATAYPFIHSPTTHVVSIENLVAADTGYEGFVEGKVGSKTIVFFDPFFSLTRNRYSIGKATQVRFGAFAYRLKKGAGKEVRSYEPGLINITRMDNPDKVKKDETGREYLAISNDSKPEMFPIEEWGPSEYTFEGVVESVRGGALGEHDVMLIRTVVLRGVGDRDLALDICAGAHTLREGFMPASGASMSGGLWLQGTLAE
jgi:hypothetical protein